MPFPSLSSNISQTKHVIKKRGLIKNMDKKVVTVNVQQAFENLQQTCYNQACR